MTAITTALLAAFRDVDAEAQALQPDILDEHLDSAAPYIVADAKRLGLLRAILASTESAAKCAAEAYDLPAVSFTRQSGFKAAVLADFTAAVTGDAADRALADDLAAAFGRPEAMPRSARSAPAAFLGGLLGQWTGE